MRGIVDITGLTYPEVLMALHEAASPEEEAVKTPLSCEKAEGLLAGGEQFATHINTLNGAFIGVTFSGQVLDIQLYDGHNGEGTAQAAIYQLRKKKAAEAEINTADAATQVPALKIPHPNETATTRRRFLGMGTRTQEELER